MTPIHGLLVAAESLTGLSAWMTETFVRGLVLLVVIDTIWRCQRHSSATTRHFTLSAGMCLLLALPLTTACLPNWTVLPRWSLAPTHSPRPVSTSPQRQTNAAEIAQLSSAIEHATDQDLTDNRIEATVSGYQTESQSTADSLTNATLPADLEPKLSSLASPFPVGSRFQLLVASGTALWFVGVAILLIRLVLSHIWLRQLARRGTLLEAGPLFQELQRLKDWLGIRSTIQLRLSTERAIPMTWGLFQPTLLLPSSAIEWDACRLRSVLTHELAHIARNDCLTQLAGQIACAIHWLNPLAWRLLTRLDQQRESACDDVVLLSGVPAADYAEHLVGVAAGLNRQQIATFGALAMARSSNLESRLLLLLNPGIERGDFSWWRGTRLLTVIALLAMPIALMHSANGADEQNPSPSAKASAGPSVDPTTQSTAVAASQAARYREFEKALEVLARGIEARELSDPRSARSTAASRMLLSLSTLPADERYRLLKSWTIPASDSAALRHFEGLMLNASPPEAFLREPTPVLDDPYVSSIVLLIEAARDAKRLDELARDLQPLVNRGVEGATLLDRLVVAVRNENLKRIRLGAIESGQELEKQLLRAQAMATFSNVLWGYRETALAIIEKTPGARLTPSADPGLTHWMPVDLAAGSNQNPFNSTSWWVALDDRIGHVCSPWVDHLVFAYPLTGTFEISADAFCGFWSEGNVGFGGLMFEAWNKGASQNQIYPLNSHEILTAAKPTERSDQFNRMTLMIAPRTMQVLANNDLVYEDSSPSTTSPFLVFRTTWRSAFRNLKITGQPVIPRQVALISGDRMEGWMSSFYNESQPPDLTDRQVQLADKVPVRGPFTSQYDWAASDDVLYGRQFAEINPPDRQTGYQHGESWLYYHRPLREGDKVAYDFYYKTGANAVEVHPTLDRLAFLLKPEGVKLHWLTNNRTADQDLDWIETNNIAEEVANRRGPAVLPLRGDAWNTVSLELKGDRVRVQLNDELIYERTVEPRFGSRFGFYHDRTKTEARIRNVVLTGEWPKWSPDLAKTLLERRSPLSPADESAIREILTPRFTERGHID